MDTPPDISLLVQRPGAAGAAFLLEDLRSGRQRHFATAHELLLAVVDVVLPARPDDTPP